MGAKHSYGAVGRGDTLNFEPEKLKVITDPKHPLYDPRVEREPEEAMILSIMRRGVLVPLIISRDGDDVYVTDGRQRRAAAIEANKRLRKMGGTPVVLPCVWKRGDEKMLYEIQVTTNELRTGDSSLERARKMQHLADLNGGDMAATAAAFGVTVATLKNYLALLECAPAVQKAVESGKVAPTVAGQLAKLDRETQTERLAKMIESGATKGAAAVKTVRGDAEPHRKTLPPTMRARIHAALTADRIGELTHVGSIAATAIRATLAFVDGDEDAFKSWPEIAALVEEAKNPKPKKQRKPKRAAKNGAEAHA